MGSGLKGGEAVLVVVVEVEVEVVVEIIVVVVVVRVYSAAVVDSMVWVRV